MKSKISTVVSESRTSSKSWLIWGIAALFYFYELILRVCPGVMWNDLMVNYNATATMLGVLVSFYYYAYTMFQLPYGIILDKLGPRNLLGLSTILCVIGSVLFVMTKELYVAQIGRFLVGAGSACAFISCLQIGAKLFSPRDFVIVAGATNMMGTLGGLFGGYPVAMAVNSIGWKHTTYLLSMVGIVVGILIFIFIPKGIGIDDTNKKEGSIFQSVGLLLKNNQILFSGIISGLMYLPIAAFSELWAIPFFMSKYNINNVKASIASGILFIGVAIGSVVMAIFARKIHSYMKTIRMSCLLTGILFLGVIYLPVSIYLSFLMVFFIGFSTGSQVIAFTCAKNNSSPDVSGTTIALTNCICSFICAIAQPAFGKLLDFFWDGKMSADGTRFYETSFYQNAMLILPVCLIASYIISMFVKETIQLDHE